MAVQLAEASRVARNDRNAGAPTGARVPISLSEIGHCRAGNGHSGRCSRLFDLLSSLFSKQCGGLFWHGKCYSLGMDIARPDLLQKMKRRRWILAGVVAAGWRALVGLSRLKPAAPTVDRSTIWPDTVKRGPMSGKCAVYDIGSARGQHRADSRADGCDRCPHTCVAGRQGHAGHHPHGLADPQLEQELLNAKLALRASQPITRACRRRSKAR